MTRPLLALRMHDAVDSDSPPGEYDPAWQLRVHGGKPLIAGPAAYDTFTEAERDPADPAEPPDPREPRAVETVTRVARDPVDPPDPPGGWGAQVETATKTIRDPADEPPQSASAFEAATDDLATGVVAF